MGCLSATWEVRGSAPAGVFTESAVSCSDNLLRCPFSAHTLGVCNGRGLASSPGDCRAPSASVAGPIFSLRLASRAEHLSPGASHFLERVASSLSQTPPPERPPGSPRGAQGVPGHVPRSRKSPPGAPGPAGRWVGRQARPSMAGRALPPTASVRWAQITAQNPAECAVSTETRCLATRADQLGWGRGASRSRKQSLTWSEAGCVPFLQAPGGWGEVIAAWRPAPRAHLAPQQT